MSAFARVTVMAALLALGAGGAHAQATAVVQGRVLDPDGAPVAGAEVELSGRASVPTHVNGVPAVLALRSGTALAQNPPQR